MRKLAVTLLIALMCALPPSAHAAGMKIVRDEEIEQTLRLFARPVLEEAGLSPQNVAFILVEDNELNAFVAGGQNIFMNTGLLLKSESAAEVVGVIAHETGHIAGGHLFRAREAVDDMSFQAMLANILGIAAAVGAKSADVGVAISSVGQTMALRSILRHTRVQESSADQAGVRFLSDAGLPVSGFLSFMEKMESQELLPDSEQTAYVRTHPLTRDRVDFLRNVVAKGQPRPEPAGWQALHERMKAKLEGYLFPDRTLAKKDAATTTEKYARATALYRKNRTSEALALIETLLKEEPKNPYFHELKGQVLFEQGRVAESLAPYAAAVEYAPRSGLIRAAYGHSLLENKKVADAINHLQKSLQTEARAPRTHHLLAIAYGKQGKEGLSRLHLAEEALLQNKLDYATKEANLALANLPEKSPSRLRAQDILDAVKRKKKEKKD